VATNELKKHPTSICWRHSVILETMEIRQVLAADLDNLPEIDATIESTRYLHVDRTGESANITWRIETRPLRTKLIEPNRLTDDQRLAAKQIATGADDGIALTIEHDGQLAALLLAQPRTERGVLKLIDLRPALPTDQRRQRSRPASRRRRKPRQQFPRRRAARQARLRTRRHRHAAIFQPRSGQRSRNPLLVFGIELTPKADNELNRPKTMKFFPPLAPRSAGVFPP
jgi:hypothetical protein